MAGLSHRQTEILNLARAFGRVTVDAMLAYPIGQHESSDDDDGVRFWTGITANFMTPELFSLGFVQEVGEDWTVSLDLTRTGWDTFPELRVEYVNPNQPDSVEEQWDVAGLEEAMQRSDQEAAGAIDVAALSRENQIDAAILPHDLPVRRAERQVERGQLLLGARRLGHLGGHAGGQVFKPQGNLLVHLAQHTITPHFHFGVETHRVSPVASRAALIGLLLHTFFDGVAIASAVGHDGIARNVDPISLALEPDGRILAAGVGTRPPGVDWAPWPKLPQKR